MGLNSKWIMDVLIDGIRSPIPAEITLPCTDIGQGSHIEAKLRGFLHSSFISGVVIKHPHQTATWRRVFIWFTIPKYNPSLSRFKGRSSSSQPYDIHHRALRDLNASMMPMHCWCCCSASLLHSYMGTGWAHGAANIHGGSSHLSQFAFYCDNTSRNKNNLGRGSFI